jgi:multiple sugar transport system substrate-binding protein/sn-glycerol 3-phosphate transport system substrate-binding protein
MKMKTRSLLALLMVASLLLAVVSACAPATPVATEAPPTEAPATEVPPTEVPAIEVPATEVPPTEVPEPCAPATEGPLAGVDPRGQTVVWWHQHSRHRLEWLDEVVPEFNATNECGITLVHENQGGYNDIRDKMNAGIATGELPGLVVGYQNDEAFYALAGGLADMNWVSRPTVRWR